MGSSMRTCAVGAMLFGGTLGGAATAHGAVVVGGLNVTAAYVWLQVGGSNFMPSPSSIGDAMAGGMAYDGSSGNSVTLSAFTSTGFSLSANGTGGDEAWTVWESSFYFTAQSDMTAVLSGNVSADAAFVHLYDHTSSTSLVFRATGAAGVAWTESAQLLNGHNYTLTVNLPSMAQSSTETGTILDFSIPAPGALALLGVVGLVGSRRRR